MLIGFIIKPFLFGKKLKSVCMTYTLSYAYHVISELQKSACLDTAIFINDRTPLYKVICVKQLLKQCFMDELIYRHNVLKLNYDAIVLNYKLLKIVQILMYLLSVVYYSFYFFFKVFFVLLTDMGIFDYLNRYRMSVR